MKLFEFAERDPAQLLAVTDAGETVTYGEINEAAALFSETVGRNLVFLLCRNTPGALLSYLGALKSAAVPLLLDAVLPPELLRGLLDVYRPAFLAAPAEMETAFTRRGTVRDYALLQTDWDGPPMGESLKLLLTTSGSTGSPKLVRVSAENLDTNAESIAEYLRIDDEERPITSLPMHYSYGMSVVNSHVLRGAALLLTERTVLERAFWEFAAKEKATSFAGVPYTYELFDRLRLAELTPPSLRTLTQAGGKLPPELHRKFAEWCRDTGRNFVVMYGQTEASPRMGYLPPEVSLEKCGSMGIAIPGGTLRLADDGELIYEGANVSLGYAETPEDLLLDDENHGILHTGDMAYRDADGYFYITGRKKRFVKLVGKRVNLDEAERLLKQRFPFPLACTGDDRTLRVYVETSHEEALPELAAYLADTASIPYGLIQIIPIRKLPVSAAGKVRYAALNQLPQQIR